MLCPPVEKEEQVLALPVTAVRVLDVLRLGRMFLFV